MEVLYFGHGDGGHFLRLRDGRRVLFKRVDEVPFDAGRLDRQFCPHDVAGQPEGVANLVHIDGWTVIAFWDRSGDSRPGSNSAFLAKGTYEFDVLLRKAEEQWPEVFERFTFKIRRSER